MSGGRFGKAPFGAVGIHKADFGRYFGKCTAVYIAGTDALADFLYI